MDTLTYLPPFSILQTPMDYPPLVLWGPLEISKPAGTAHSIHSLPWAPPALHAPAWKETISHSQAFPEQHLPSLQSPLAAGRCGYQLLSLLRLQFL